MHRPAIVEWVALALSALALPAAGCVLTYWAYNSKPAEAAPDPEVVWLFTRLAAIAFSVALLGNAGLLMWSLYRGGRGMLVVVASYGLAVTLLTGFVCWAVSVDGLPMGGGW